MEFSLFSDFSYTYILYFQYFRCDYLFFLYFFLHGEYNMQNTNSYLGE